MRGHTILRGIIKPDQSWRPDELWRKAFRVVGFHASSWQYLMVLRSFSATSYIPINMISEYWVRFHTERLLDPIFSVARCDVLHIVTKRYV